MKLGENIASEFNEFAKDYTNDMIRCVPHYEKLISSFTEYLPEGFSPSSILELGSGNGNVTAALLQHFPKANYTLVDASKEMIDLCKLRFKDFSMSYSNSYFNEFDFNKNQYDLVVAGFSLHHCNEEEKQVIFKNIYASLKPNGIFSCSDLMISKKSPEHSGLLKKWEAFVLNNYPNREKWEWLMEHYNTFDQPTNYNTQIDWLKKVGFSKVHTPFREEYWTYLQAIK